MKPKQLLGILLLLVGTILSGCNHSEVDDKKEETIPNHPWVFEQYDTIYIDSTATACGIDSCVLYFPWLNDKINTFLKDSAERKQNMETHLKIDVFVYDIPGNDEKAYYFSDYIEDKNTIGTIWHNCDGDTIWEDPNLIRIVDDTLSMPGKDDFFVNILDKKGVRRGQQTIVQIDFGIVPGGE